jgi:AAA15 family ATPase/GTPase
MEETMRIQKVRLKNGYKRFRDLTIDLGDNPARIIALVGPNGCGKSSVLDGLLYHASAHGRLGSGPNRDYTYHSMDSEPAFNWQNIEIQFTHASYQEAREKKRASGKEGTIFSFRSPYRYNSHLKINETKATEESKAERSQSENYRRPQ